ncbi:synaptotagmin-2 [Diretmus argenteus]
MVMESPASLWLSDAAGWLRLPFSDPITYFLLAISVALLLLALGILLWQIFRCCSQTYTTDTAQNTVNSGYLLRSYAKFSTAGNYSGTPSTTVENLELEASRMSRCLSVGSFPSQAGGELEEQAIPETVHGSLRFSLYYDQLQSSLVVTVLQARGLQGKNQSHSLQPFVRLRLMRAGPDGVEVGGVVDEECEGAARGLWTVLQQWQTRIVKDSCNPLFGDQFSCILQEEQLHHMTLRMEVRDFDKFSRHVVLGEVRVPLGRLKISYPLELQEDLQTPQKDHVGEVLLSLKFLPTSQRLEVGLLKISTLLTDETHTNITLFARISVQCNQCKLRHQKTSAVARCQVTVFNQVLVFSLPEFPLEQCKILVSVYETHAAGKPSKNLIGQLTVGKGRNSEDQHWSLMMRAVRQPIAKWHCLLI